MYASAHLPYGSLLAGRMFDMQRQFFTQIQMFFTTGIRKLRQFLLFYTGVLQKPRHVTGLPLQCPLDRTAAHAPGRYNQQVAVPVDFEVDAPGNARPGNDHVRHRLVR